MRPPGTAVPPLGASAERRENAVLRELVAVYSHLSGLAAQDTDVAGVVAVVAARTGAAVAVLGPGLDPLAAEPADAAERVRRATGPRLPAVLAAAARTRRPTAVPGLTAGPAGAPPAVVVAPILVGDEVAAHLVTVAEGAGAELGEDLALLLTEHAATICGIVLGRERVVAAAAGRARADLVEGLLLARDGIDGADAAAAGRWARHLGFATGVPHRVLAIGPAGAPGEPERARLLAAVEQALHRGLPDAIVAVRDAEVVAIVPAVVPDAARALAEQCVAGVAARHPGLPVVAGVGGACTEPVGIARSYAQARGALDAGTRMGPGPRVVAFDELGVHRLLLQVPDLGQLRAFAADTLGALRGQPELLETLTVWFRCTGSPQRTARELAVHPNTVAYRVRRIEELTGLRLDHHRDRLTAQVACEILDVLGGSP